MGSLNEYLYKIVEVKTKDGRTLTGEVVAAYEPDETPSGGAEIGIHYHKLVEDVGEREIESIKIVG